MASEQGLAIFMLLLRSLGIFAWDVTIDMALLTELAGMAFSLKTDGG